MSSKARFVFDTNVLISALLFKNSKPRQALRLAIKTGDILLSKQTLEELNKVISRPKFDRYVMSEEKEEFEGYKHVAIRLVLEVVQLLAVCSVLYIGFVETNKSKLASASLAISVT